MIITEEGRYLLNDFVSGDGGNKLILYVSGVDDGVTMMLQFHDERGNYVNLQNGAVVNATQNVINTGVGMHIYLNVTNRANTATLSLAITVKGMS